MKRAGWSSAEGADNREGSSRPDPIRHLLGERKR